MSLFAVALVLGASSLGAEPQSASLPTYWRYSHPEAKVLMGVDVRGILNSPLGQKLFQEMKSMGGAWTSSASAEDMELLQGIERVFLSAPAQAGNLSGAVQREAVVAIQGTFDPARLRRMLGARGKRSSYKGVEMWSESGSSAKAVGAQLAIVSPQVILIGDSASLRAAIDHHASADPNRAYDPVFLRATEMAPLYEIWFVGNIPPKSLTGDGAAPAGPMAAFDTVESFEAGISIKQGMQLQFNLNTVSPAEASKIAQGLAGMMMFATAAQADTPELGEFLKRVKFGSAGAQVQVSALWSQAELESGMKQMQARVKQALPGALAAVPTRPAASGVSDWNVAPAASRPTVANAEPAYTPEPPPPAGPLTVKILNAEGGNKEVVINPKP
ncbi:MAG: hypothetical protein J0L64_11120 [Acidobacteria bacterium]|nr:hypothetical protein [Acidobacteriota bacterium]